MTKNYSHLKVLVPHLNNPSEERSHVGSNKIKEKHETMKLQNKEDMLKNF